VTVEVVNTEDPHCPQVIGELFFFRAAADDRKLHFPAAALVPTVTVFHDLPFVLGCSFEKLEVDHPVLDLITVPDQLVAIGGLNDDMNGLHVEDLESLDGGFFDGALVRGQHLIMSQPPHFLRLTDVDTRHPAVDHDVVPQDIDGYARMLRHSVCDPPLETTGLGWLPLVGRYVDGERDLGFHHQPIWPATAVTKLLDQGELLEWTVEFARQEVADHLGLDWNLLPDAAELHDQNQVVAVDRLRWGGVDGAGSLEYLAVLAEPFQVVPVVRLEMLGLGETFIREVEIATVLGLGMDVVDPHDIDHLCARGKVADADTGSAGSDFRHFSSACSGIG
jgi:hypothetical protein